MPAHELLAGQFNEDEAQEIADAICDQVLEANNGELPHAMRWQIEAGVLAVFGYSEVEKA